MIVSIHQPEFLPWIPFFDKVAAADVFVLLDNVQFEKNYYQNRCKIYDGNVGHQLLTLPLKTAPHSCLINQREIDFGNLLFSKNKRTIEQRYSRAPFYSTYMGDLFRYMSQNSNLAEYNGALISWMSNCFKISTKIVTASSLMIDQGIMGSMLILSICRSLNAKTYLSGAYGKDYLNLDDFKSHGIDVKFQSYKLHSYNKIPAGEGVLGLSAVDLLFSHGDHSLSYIVQGRCYE